MVKSDYNYRDILPATFPTEGETIPMKTLALRLRLATMLPLLAMVASACSLTDMVNSVPTSAPTMQEIPTALPSCKPAATASEVGDILFNAEVTLRAQPSIGITMIHPTYTQWVEFVKPDKFHWKVEAGTEWEEAITVGGKSYARSSTQAWASTPLLTPSAATAMKELSDPPVKLSVAFLSSLIGNSPDVKIEARLVGLVPDFFGTCVYAITVKSGDRIMYAQKTWIGPNDNLPYKFEASDETITVTETRLFDYDPINLTAPIP
jgi:hypothetical protein